MATSTDFDDWYAENYARVLVAVALVLGPDRDRAEDATNEAFVLSLIHISEPTRPY